VKTLREAIDELSDRYPLAAGALMDVGFPIALGVVVFLLLVWLAVRFLA
jgi:hypothetical protein